VGACCSYSTTVRGLYAIIRVGRFANTVLSNRDHYILDTYGNPELYSWFLKHVRRGE
jgi:hypothetical protein